MLENIICAIIYTSLPLLSPLLLPSSPPLLPSCPVLPSLSSPPLLSSPLLSRPFYSPPFPSPPPSPSPFLPFTSLPFPPFPSPFPSPPLPLPLPSPPLPSPPLPSPSYLACALMARGKVNMSDIRSNIERLQPSLNLVHWNQQGWKTGLCSIPPTVAPAFRVDKCYFGCFCVFWSISPKLQVL